MFLVLFSDHNAPFAQWSTERVCNWLEDFGLGQYVIFARQWVTSGHTLLTATPQDMEKVITASLYLLILNQVPPNHCLYLSEIPSINFRSYLTWGKEPEAGQTLCWWFLLQEMGIKHPLHRKKLVLAIKAINAKQDEKSAQLDHIWVTRKCLDSDGIVWEGISPTSMKGAAWFVFKQLPNIF